MKFGSHRASNTLSRAAKAQGGFTLAEVLAAMLFMAIVIPVAVQGLRISSVAGVVAQRKSQAMRIADRLLTEALLSTNTVQTTQSGTVVEGVEEFQYYIRVGVWDQPLTNSLPQTSSTTRLTSMQPEVNQLAVTQVRMDLLSVEVLYPVQGKDYSVRLDTLIAQQ